jgi:hypothetical protein
MEAWDVEGECVVSFEQVQAYILTYQPKHRVDTVDFLCFLGNESPIRILQRIFSDIVVCKLRIFSKTVLHAHLHLTDFKHTTKDLLR